MALRQGQRFMRDRRGSLQQSFALRELVESAHQKIAERCAHQILKAKGRWTLREMRKLLLRCCADPDPDGNFNLHHFILLNENAVGEKPEDAIRQALSAGKKRKSAEPEGAKREEYTWKPGSPSAVTCEITITSESTSGLTSAARREEVGDEEEAKYWRFAFKAGPEPPLDPPPPLTSLPHHPLRERADQCCKNTVAVYHIVPASLDEDKLMELKSKLDGLRDKWPNFYRALCALAFAIKHKEAVLLEGPGCPGFLLVGN